MAVGDAEGTVTMLKLSDALSQVIYPEIASTDQN